MPKSKVDVCRAAGDALLAAWRALDPKDADRACAIERRLNRRLHRGEYRDADAVRNDAHVVAFLKRARNPMAAGEWIDKIIALIERLIPLFVK